MKKHYLTTLLFLVSLYAFGQGMVSTTPPLLPNNGAGGITFEVESQVSTVVTDIFNTFTAGSNSVSVWVRTGGVQTTFGAAPVINAANGWVQLISGVTVVGNGETPVQIPSTSLNIMVPAFIPVGIYIEGETRYQTHTGTQDVFTDGTLTIRTGANYGYGGGLSPTFTPRQFLGTLFYTLGAPCPTPPIGGVTQTTETLVCSGGSPWLFLGGASGGANQTYQWQSSMDTINWTNRLNDTLSLLNPTISTSTYFRCQISCGGQSATSTPVLVSAITAPLAAGTYTINQSIPSSPSNFKSFSELANVLNCQGISGPIVVNVSPNTGPYLETVRFSNINTTASNTITINGNGETIEGTPKRTTGPDKGIFTVENTNNFTIDSLTVSSAASFTEGAGILVFGNCSNVIIKNCFVDIAFNVSAINSAAIGVTNNPTNFMSLSTVTANHITIEGNVISGGYFGISLVGGGDFYRATNNIIRNNNIKEFHSHGIFAGNQDNLLVTKNEISRPTRPTAFQFRGVALTGNMGGVEISRNSIHTPFGQSKNQGLLVGIFTNNIAQIGLAPNYIINNRIFHFENNGITYGIWNNNSHNMKYYHNTIDINDPNSTVQNVAISTAGFYTTFNSGDIAFCNNIVSVRRSGGGFKHAIFLDGTGSKTLNNNGYYLDPSFFGSEFTPGFSTFAAYQTNPNGHDTNSVFDFPAFSSPATGLLLPNSFFMDNIGQNLLSIVPTDFFDSARTTTPDPGAFEYSPSPCPTPLITLVNTLDTVATLNFLSQASGATFEVEWGPTGFPQGTGNTQNTAHDTIQISGLIAGSCYDVYVRLNCSNSGNGVSPTSIPFTFCTVGCDTAVRCPYTFRMISHQLNGWDGNTMTVLQGGLPVGTIGSNFTSGNGPRDTILLLCPGSFELKWNLGGMGANQIRVEILDQFDRPVFQMPFNSQALRGSVIHTSQTICGTISCWPPTNFSFLAATDSSATFTFTPGGGTTAIEVGPVGFIPGTGSVTYVSSSPGVVSGLAANTAYEAYFFDTCAATATSPVLGPIPFSTACAIESLPYFENYSVWPTTCWQYNSGNFFWDRHNTNGVNFVKAVLGWFSSANQDAAVMTTVPIDISTEARVRYNWFRNSSTNTADSLYVLSRIAGAATWDTLKAFGDPNFSLPGTIGGIQHPTPNFQEEIHYLPLSYVGNVAEFRFVGKAAPGGATVFMDFFTVEAVPNCIVPTGLVASNIGATTVDLNWLQVGPVTAWDVEWGLAGFSPGNGTIVQASSTAFTLTGLPSATCLDIYLNANCTASNNGTSGRIGPVSICTLKEFDAAMSLIVSPPIYSCGTNGVPVEVQILNLGTQPITSLPITVEITGGITQTFTTTFSGNLTAGNTTNVVLGSINTGSVATLDVTAYCELPNDQEVSNDTIYNQLSSFIPEVPQGDSALYCPGNTHVEFSAASYPGVSYAWYDVPTGGAPLFYGNPFQAPVGPMTYYLSYSDSTSSYTYSYSGNDISADHQFRLPHQSSNCPGIIKAKIPVGTTILGVDISYSMETVLSSVPTQFSELRCVTTGLNEGVLAQNSGIPGQMIYNYNRTGLTIANGITTTDEIVFELHAGSSWGPQGCNQTIHKVLASSIQLTVHYKAASCNALRTPVHIRPRVMPTANFSTTLDGSRVTFTNLSTNADAFLWDMGGQGISPNPNPPPWNFIHGGTQVICLYAFNECGVDTLCQTVTSISTENYSIGQEELNVYPNPSTNVFNVELRLVKAQAVYLRVLSPTGQAIRDELAESSSDKLHKQIDLSGYAKGIYLLQIQTENGIATRRLSLM